MANINLTNVFSESDSQLFASALFLTHQDNLGDSEVNRSYNNTNESLSEDSNPDDLTNFLTKDLVNLIDESPLSSFRQENTDIPSLALESDSDGDEFNKRKDSTTSSLNKNSSFSTVVTLDDKDLSNETTNILNVLKEDKTSENTEEKGDKKPFVQREGDWDCMKCKNMNFAFRAHCNRCKCSKVDSEILKGQQAKVIATCLQYTQMMQLKMMTMMRMSQVQMAATQSMKNLSSK